MHRKALWKTAAIVVLIAVSALVAAEVRAMKCIPNPGKEIYIGPYIWGCYNPGPGCMICYDEM